MGCFVLSINAMRRDSFYLNRTMESLDAGLPELFLLPDYPARCDAARAAPVGVGLRHNGNLLEDYHTKRPARTDCSNLPARLSIRTGKS